MQAGIADVPAGPEAVKATPVKRPTPNSGKFTISALTVKAESKKLEVEAIREAVALCEAGNGGAAKAAKKFGIPRGKLGYALDKGVDRRTGESILTAKELHQLAKWVTGSARNINPAKPSECSSKVVSILKARKHFNRAKKFGRGCIPLTAAEKGVLERGRVSETIRMVLCTLLHHLSPCYSTPPSLPLLLYSTICPLATLLYHLSPCYSTPPSLPLLLYRF